MLKPPYNKYSRLYFYILGLPEVPFIDDLDYIGGWQEDGTVMLFFHSNKDDQIKELCEQRNCEVIYQADMDYNDWENGGEISPFSVGDLSVAPVWHDGEAQIKLDPSVIFGNGFHPTTRLCLESLVSLIKITKKPMVSALDLGCGTGLLAISLAKGGLDKVKAIDHNELACLVANSNVHANNIVAQVEVQQIDLTEQIPDTNVDLVVANLHHELLIELFRDPSFWEAKYYIISGFFTSKEELLLKDFPLEKIKFIDRGRRDKWGVWVLTSN